MSFIHHLPHWNQSTVGPEWATVQCKPLHLHIHTVVLVCKSFKWFFFSIICFPSLNLWHCALFHLTLAAGSSTLLSLATGSPGTTAFIIEILSCQVALHTCQAGLKGAAPAPLLCCSAWFFIASHRRLLRRCFQPYVNIIHFLMWQLRTGRHGGAHYFTKPCLHSRGLRLTAPLSPLYSSVTLLEVILFIWGGGTGSVHLRRIEHTLHDKRRVTRSPR